MLISKDINEVWVEKKIESWQTQGLAIKNITLPTRDDIILLNNFYHIYDDIFRQYWTKTFINTANVDNKYYVGKSTLCCFEVDRYGCNIPTDSIYSGLYPSTLNIYVKPVLEIEDISNDIFWNMGNVFKIGSVEFTIISLTKAICSIDIGKCVFDKNDYITKYEGSQIERYILDWLSHSSPECYQMIHNKSID